MLKRKGARANGRRIDHAFSARFKTARCPASVVQLRSSRPRDGPLCETAAHPSPLTQSPPHTSVSRPLPDSWIRIAPHTRSARRRCAGGRRHGLSAPASARERPAPTRA